MITAADRGLVSDQPQRKKRRQQSIEVRLVVELQLPPWLQQMQPGPITVPVNVPVDAASVAARSQTGHSHMNAAERRNVAPASDIQEESRVVPTQDSAGAAFVATSVEQGRELVISETKPDSEEPQTLLACYEKFMRAKRERSAGKKAIAEHLSSCRCFDEFTRLKIHHRFYTPMVNFLKTSDLLTSFAAWAIGEKGLSRVTVSKRIEHVVMVARESFELKLDKPTSKELKRMEDSRPKSAPPSDGRRIPSFEEIDSLARAAHVAKWPYRSHAPYFWRGLIRFAAFVGFRTYDIVSLIPDKTGLTKSDIVWESLCPVADVSNALGYDLHSPHGWLHYAVNKDTHSDCRRILIPMPKWLRDWVRFFFELSSHAERIFPAMKRLSLDTKGFGQNWQRIVKAAEVDPRIRLSEGTGDVIALRKYAANWWSLAALRSSKPQFSALSETVSHYILHHAEVTTASKHYISTQAKILPLMLELMDLWPLPAADAKPVSLLPE